jgi:hypothetical protein
MNNSPKFAQEQQRQAAEQRRQANDIAKLKGFVLELIFDRRAPAVFGRYWRRVKVVPATEICELAESIQPLTPEEEESLYRADAYVMGVRKSDGREIIGVVEVSWMVDIGDVERAQRRAEVLTQARAARRARRGGRRGDPNRRASRPAG